MVYYTQSVFTQFIYLVSYNFTYTGCIFHLFVLLFLSDNLVTVLYTAIIVQFQFYYRTFVITSDILINVM